MEHRMQWTQEGLIEQIIDGTKTATVRRVEWSEGYDDLNTPLHVGMTYGVHDREGRERCRVRITAIELARWGAIPERLWREDLARQHPDTYVCHRHTPPQPPPGVRPAGQPNRPLLRPRYTPAVIAVAISIISSTSVDTIRLCCLLHENADVPPDSADIDCH